MTSLKYKINLILFTSMAIFFMVISLYWLVLATILLCLLYLFLKSKSRIVVFVKKHFALWSVFSITGIFFLSIAFRLFMFELFSIPSGSMENTLYTGDKIIVSKLQYGPRMPRSGFEIPWLNLFWYLNPEVRGDMGENEWGYHRLSGYSQIKHGDVLVFNYPGKMFEFFIKRCMALPGDSLNVINAKVYINNNLQAINKNTKLKYKVYYHKLGKLRKQIDSLKKTTGFKHLQCNFFNAFQARTMTNTPIRRKSDTVTNEPITKAPYLLCYMGKKQKSIVENLTAVDSLCVQVHEFDSISRVFPYIDSLHWTIDNYGPILIPAKNTTIKLDLKNYKIYNDIFNKFEDANIVNTDSGFYIGNKSVKSYRFKQNYYFMMGDNRHKSMDSRYWGFVPESHIVGKAVLVLFSYNEGFKWDRFFKLVD